MATSEYGDGIQKELLAATDVLDPTIDRVRDYLLGYEEMYRDDPIVMRDLLWRSLDAMAVSRQHIRTAEWLRYVASPKRLAALERERKKMERNE